MSRYFFHIRDGTILVPDEEGVECHDLPAAWQEALSSLSDIAVADLRMGAGMSPVTVEIEDEEGNPVINLPPYHALH
jgi:hypothetical protein